MRCRDNSRRILKNSTILLLQFLNYGSFFFCSRKKNFLNRTQKNIQPESKKMKTKALILLVAVSLFTVGAATAQSTLSQNSTWNLTSSSQTFTFNQFNPALGNLTAAQLIINSASANGSISITNNSGNDSLIDIIRSRITVSGTGFSTGNTPQISLTTSPALTFNLLDGNSQIFTVSSQSLLSTAYTRNVTTSLASYSGTGSTPNFTAFLTNTVSSTETVSSIFSLTAPSTSVTLLYTYTPSVSPVPEPGQVVASLLLLGGIGAYVFIKRRKKSAPAVV